MKRTITLLAISLMVFASTAQAAIVNSWDYTITGSFIDSEFTPVSGVYSEGATQLTWGTPLSGQSKLRYFEDDATVEGTANTYLGEGSPNSFFADSVTLVHDNNPITAGSGSLVSTTLQIAVTLTPIMPGFVTPYNAVFDFPILFFETPNAPGIPYSNDIFALDFVDFPNLNFDYDGYTYFVNIFPTNLGTFSTIPALNVDVANDMAALNTAYQTLAYDTLGFTTVENESTIAPFAFLISTNPITNVVPEPSTMLLMGAGLLGLAAIGRRKARM